MNKDNILLALILILLILAQCTDYKLREKIMLDKNTEPTEQEIEDHLNEMTEREEDRHKHARGLLNVWIHEEGINNTSEHALHTLTMELCSHYKNHHDYLSQVKELTKLMLKTCDWIGHQSPKEYAELRNSVLGRIQ